MAKAIAAGLVVAAVVLLGGYMCGAPVVLRSPDNFLAYWLAFLFGAAAFVAVLATEEARHAR